MKNVSICCMLRRQTNSFLAGQLVAVCDLMSCFLTQWKPVDSVLIIGFHLLPVKWQLTCHVLMSLFPVGWHRAWSVLKSQFSELWQSVHNACDSRSRGRAEMLIPLGREMHCWPRQQQRLCGDREGSFPTQAFGWVRPPRCPSQRWDFLLPYQHGQGKSLLSEAVCTSQGSISKGCF